MHVEGVDADALRREERDHGEDGVAGRHQVEFPPPVPGEVQGDAAEEAEAVQDEQRPQGLIEPHDPWPQQQVNDRGGEGSEDRDVPGRSGREVENRFTAARGGGSGGHTYPMHGEIPNVFRPSSEEESGWFLPLGWAFRTARVDLVVECAHLGSLQRVASQVRYLVTLYRAPRRSSKR